MSALSDLESALPAETVTALSTTPQGLTEAGQVYVGDVARAASSVNEAWWRLVEVDGLRRGIGSTLVGYRFELSLSRKDGTQAELRTWADQIRAHFDGFAKPTSVTGIVSVSVEEGDEQLEDPGPVSVALLRVVFVVKETP